MKKIMLFFCVLFGSRASDAQSIDRINGTSITAEQLTSHIENVMFAAHVTGASVAVFNNNSPIYLKTFGLANVERNMMLTPNAEMYAASFAKTVFAYVVGQLVQEKILDLDKPLVEYLPRDLTSYDFKTWKKGYQSLAGDDRYKKITGRMCMTHTTGFPNWRWIEDDKKLKFRYDPGVRYSYSGEGLYLLQFVIEQITGKDYETICQERVFRPFHMDGTSMLWQSRFDSLACYGYGADQKPFPLSKRKEANCAGSMTTTPADFAKFFTAFINHDGLSAKTFKEITSKQVSIRSRRQFGPLAAIDSTGNDSIQLGYGLGVGVFQTPYGKAFFKEGHDDGWGHYSICYPDKKIAIIIMTNSDNGESIFKDLLEYAIGDIYTPWQWENYIPFDAKK